VNVMAKLSALEGEEAPSGGEKDTTPVTGEKPAGKKEKKPVARKQKRENPAG
jgi:hypothetical protein